MKPKYLLLCLFVGIVLLGISPGISLAAPPAQEPTPTPEGEETLPAEIQELTREAQAKIESLVVEELTLAGQTDFFIWLREKADLRPAYQLKSKEEKGQFVFETLRQTAERSQAALRQALDGQGADYRPFYIANKILIRGGNAALVADVAARSDVARITADHTFQLPEPIIDPHPPAHVLAVEPSLSFVNADDVWALGYDGSGVVLAGNDTGLDWDHPALIHQYRGWDGVTVNHNHNWWDATGTYPAVPSDGHGHGTHTTGTMVGDDGSANQIGMAPGARTIHCKNMADSGYGSDATFTECFEWDLAPWDLSGANPRPDLAPDAINNSWGYYGNHPAFEDEIAALQAAGILVEVSAGNDGPYCATLRSPGDYRQSLTTGSVNHAGGSLPGTLTGFSSRGPSDLYPADYIPDVMAPGENIRSSVPGGGYQGGWSGTSMSGPHVTGLVGLMWSANPGLRGMVTETVQIILDTAVPLAGQTGSNCGGDYLDGPNHDWGHGTIDALAAVQRALSYGGTGILAGTVTDALSLAPVSGATVQATLSPTLTWQTASGVLGNYALQVFSGTYTVTASVYGYQPTDIANVSVVSGTTTTLAIPLAPAPSYVVSGTVTDAVTGWPLYASLDIDGYPGGTIWTDPVSGFYSVTLAGGTTYGFDVNAWVPGYHATSRIVGPLTANQTEDFALMVDVVACIAPGYAPSYIYFEDFDSFGNWTMTGLWNSENEGDICGSQVAPFPSASDAAYYGLDGVCTYDNGSANSGELTLVAPVTLPASGSAVLSSHSYEETECDGDCSWDNRYIEISDNSGGTWATLSEGNTEGSWYQGTFDLTPYLGSDIMIRFRFDTVDSVLNSYFGWMIDDVSINTGCVPMSGGLVVGNIYDANTGHALAGATVDSDSGQGALTDANGFYELFDTPGTHIMTGTMSGGYGPDAQTVTIVQSDTVQQDFHLPAGWLSPNPTALEATLYLGESVAMPLNLTNNGGLTATFELREVDRGSVIWAQPSFADQLHAEGNDESHVSANVQIGVVGYGSYWATTLNADPELSSDYTFVDLGDNWTYGLIQGYDGILVNESDYGLTTGETAALRQYYDAGGLVLLGMDDVDDEGPTEQADVYYIFGVTNAQDGNFYVGSLNPAHPIAEGVTLSSMGYDNDHFDQDGATWVVRGDDGADYVLAREGAARTVILGEQMSQWWSGGNDGLVRNAIKWAVQVDVPWLFENPITGTIASSANQVITITFDAGIPEITHPGQYYAELRISDDTPYDLPNVPVTMTVARPPTWGKLSGTVHSLGRCDFNPAPLENADVLIESSSGMTWTLTTEISGTYAHWLGQGPYTVTVSYADHLTDTAVVSITAQATTTHDVDLHWMQPCVSLVPPAIEAALDIGISTTLSMSISNGGAAALEFEISGLSCVAVAGQSVQTSGDLDDTYVYPGEMLGRIHLYAYSSDNDTLDALVTAYNPDTDTWDTLYSGSGGARLILDQTYDPMVYSQVRVQLDDTENNDTIYYDYSFEWCPLFTWLTIAPITGTVSPYSTTAVALTFDAGQVDQPDVFTTSLHVSSNDSFNPSVTVPVTMTVTPPPTWGKLWGTVRGLGYCNENPAPLENVVLLIEDSAGVTWTLETDVNGAYRLWLDEAHSPLSIAATYPDHETGRAKGVAIRGQMTTAQDFDLRWLQPCISVDPSALNVRVPMGQVVTRALTVSNIGASMSYFALTESDGGFSTSAPGSDGGTIIWLMRNTEGVPVSISDSGSTVAYPGAYHYTPAHSFPAATVQILAYTDDWIHPVPNTLVQQALRRLGLAATVHVDGDYAGFEAALAADKPWDLVIWSGENYPVPTTTLTALLTYLQNGGKLAATYWQQSDIATDPLWAEMGLVYLSNYLDPRPAYWWNPRHPVFSEPESAPEWLVRTAPSGHSQGTVVNPLANGYAVAGYTTSPLAGEGAIVVRDDGMAVYKAIRDITTDEDADWSGTPDGVELWENIISGLLDSFGNRVSWLSETPTGGSIAADGAQAIEVVFDAGASEVTGPGEYTTTLIVQSDDPVTPWWSVPIAMTVTSFGVEVTPSEDASWSYPNATVTYTLCVTNTGLNTDIFDIVVTGNAWPTTAPAQLGPLAAGASDTIDVMVTIPASVAGGTTDMATITIASQGDDTRSTTATLITTVVSYTLFLPLVTR